MFTFGHDPLASSFDQTLLQKIPFFNDINISTPSPSFENFQPYEENYDPSSFLQDLLQHQQEHHVTPEEDGVSATKDHILVNKMVEKSENRNDGIRNKRSCKKDRHSKIDTAHGPRDRRMRLSLEVARKFFGLQDMLKFDKASKTVDWLLNKSKSAIEEIEAARGHMISKKNSSSNSNNDASNDDGNNNIINNNNINNNNNSNSSVMMRSTTASSTTSECEVVSSKKMKPKKEKGSTRNSSTRKCRSHFSSSHPKIAKESRIKARERAKQRTREKSRMMTMTTMSRSNNYKDSHAENCGESGTQSGQNSDNSIRNPSSLNHHHQVVEKLYCKDQLRANQEMGGNNDSASVGKWSPCPAPSTVNCFSSEQQGQLSEFPFSKQWEGNPNQFLC